MSFITYKLLYFKSNQQIQQIQCSKLIYKAQRSSFQPIILQYDKYNQPEKQNDEINSHESPCPYINIYPKSVHFYHYISLHEAHKKKLDQIRQQRKSYIGFDNNRLTQISHFRQNKNKSFAHRFNQHSVQIQKQNEKLFVKLVQAKKIPRYSTSQEPNQSRYRQETQRKIVSPFLKRQFNQTQKENARMENRRNSISSSLNQKNFYRDFAKSQQIKSRIMRYALQNNKVSLKSQKFINLNTSVLSKKSEKSQDKNDKVKNRKSAISYYKKEDIMKNKVESVGRSLRRLKNQQRPNTTLDEPNQENTQGFFSTEPVKNVKRRGYKI